MKKLLFVGMVVLLGSSGCHAMSVEVIPVTDETREPLREFVHSIYHAEGCGICGKEGAEVFWFNPHSRCAHRECYDFLSPALEGAYAVLDEVFGDDNSRKNDAHHKLVRLVLSQIGQQTILECANKSGIDYLKKLFNQNTRQAIDHILANKSAWK